MIYTNNAKRTKLFDRLIYSEDHNYLLNFNQKEFSEALPRGLAEKFEKRQVFQVGM